MIEQTAERIFSGDPVNDMEIAKRLIAEHPNIDLPTLIAIASERRQSPSARIAAIYVLGFTDDRGVSRSTLTHISCDMTEPNEIREHATDALAENRNCSP